MIDPEGKVTRMELGPIPPGYLSLDQTCKMLGISHPTLYRWIKVGLPSHQVTPKGRRLFLADEVRDWLKSRCIDTAPDQTTDEQAV
jgi:excisionase family DNA binding protein